MELQETLRYLNRPNLEQIVLVDHFTQKRIQMKHIPPKSQHWGGMYEDLTRAVKMSVKTVLHSACISLSEMQTLI